MIGIRRHKYVVLLALLVVALAIDTFGAQSGAERLRSDALRTVLSVAIWIVVFERPRERRIMAAVLFVLLAINWGRYFTAASLDRALWLAESRPGWRSFCTLGVVLSRRRTGCSPPARYRPQARRPPALRIAADPWDLSGARK